ncbi:hypothetical protein L249_1570 [Ophiocordyceps polyrhachis-furcata BCC 54312]|uniref:Enoyl reductase (ER) domain-containing protein n=1 Tax=Ophiocordyceps polyrhachis-furcata BCC 54312 TaxID=1330021 RepID=A0A367L496_9HYPO|nr:hypothetical protein L249_1570 [Ophiocordyceps polyrhachis-furcata BCC 54312]
MMKAIDIKGGSGSREALFLNPSTPKPVPGKGQALVRVHAFGINRMDILQRRGAYPVPVGASRVLGVEFSGVIDSLGDVDNDRDRDRDRDRDGTTLLFAVGDEVMGLVYGGAYAQYLVASLEMLLRKPPSLTWPEAAALPEAWMTATQALHSVLDFVPGRSILWHAGASGVSVAGIQLARRAGASRVYATAGSDEKCRFVVDRLGADAAFNYKACDWAAALGEATDGRGVDYIVDFVGGGHYFNKNLDVCAVDARIVLLGLLGGPNVPDANISQLLSKRIRIEGSTLRSRSPDYQRRLRHKLETYMPDFEARRLCIIIDQAFPWEQIQEAHKHMEEARNTGKIVCTISS